MRAYDSTTDSSAMVLAGAVARGAFAVGAVSVVAEAGIRVRRIAATSSGALTAAIVGAGIASGRFARAVDVASNLWEKHGAWSDIAHVSLGALLHGEGVLDTSKLAGLVKEGIAEVLRGANGGEAQAPASEHVKVTLVATDLGGSAGGAGRLPTYERAIPFTSADFLDSRRWADIATAAAASATFPGLFAPTMIGDAPCIDGGAVNNGPISYLLDDPTVQRVFIVTSHPSTPVALPEPLGGMELVGQMADVVISERLSRDLDRAMKTNLLLERVKAAMAEAGLSESGSSSVLRALGWRELDLRLICPETALAGTSFTAFSDATLRTEYVAAGMRAARRVLGQ